MNKIYEKNLELVKQLNINMFNKVSTTEIENSELIVGHNYKNIMKLINGNKISIHSSFDSKPVGRHLRKKIAGRDSDIVMIFGCGLGYEVREILKSCVGKTVFVIEPDKEIFKLMLQVYDMRTIIAQKGVFFTQDECAEDIATLIINFMNENKQMKIDIITLPAYKVIYNDLLKKILEFVNEFINNYRVEMITNVTFHRQWCYNYIMNLKYIRDARSIKSLVPLFKNVPVIIVGAGPSLKYDIEALTRYNNKAIIVAAGTGIDVLEKNNLRAHFVGAISGGIGEENIFNNLKLNKDINLLYSSQVFNSVPSLVNGKRFLMNQTIMDSYLLRRLKYNAFNLYSGPSIVNVLAQNLMEIGCNPIILLGTDFCYSSGETYAIGAKEHSDIDNLEGKEDSENFIKTINKKGEEVYTIRPFLTMRYEMERLALKFNNCKLYNAARDGLKIDNVDDIILEDFLSQLPDLNVDEKIEVTVNSISEEFVSKEIEQIIEDINTDNKKVIEICKELVLVVEENNSDLKKRESVEKLLVILKDLPFFYEVLRSIIDQVAVLYEDRPFSEKIKLTYLYLLDKCLVIEECFNNYL